MLPGIDLIKAGSCLGIEVTQMTRKRMTILRWAYCVSLLLVLLPFPSLGQDKPSPNEVKGVIKPPFAWNCPDRYEAPDSKTFFPDDAEATVELARCLQGVHKWPTDVDERLGLIRRGLRHLKRHRTQLLGALGNEFIWNKDNQDPRAIELLYQATDLAESEDAHTAFYHGPSVVSERTPNLVRTLMQQYQGLSEQDQARISWGMKTYGDKDRTRQLLLELLESHKMLDEGSVCATINTYRAVFETDPPDMQRFAQVGKWIVAFHRSDVSASHPRAAQILREQINGLMRGQEDRIIDFVTRVNDGQETAVVLLQGEQARNHFSKRLAEHVFTKVDFNVLLSPRILQENRLREFGRYLPKGAPDRARPEYSRPEADETFAFNASTYIPPGFEAYFADDAEAAKKLDDVYEHRDTIEIKDRELLELFRRGVRRSSHTPNTMLGWISGALGWPVDPKLKEIIYQATDSQGPFKFRDSAVYYGYNLHAPKTKNMLEALFQAYMAPPFDRTTNGNFRTRILWSVRDHEDDCYFLETRFAGALKNHQELSDDALRSADQAYRHLSNNPPRNYQEYDSRIINLVGFNSREVHDVETAKKLFQARIGKLDYLLDSECRPEKDEIWLLCVTRGYDAPRQLSEQLQQKLSWPVYFVLPLTPESWPEMSEKLPERFHKHLPGKD